MATALATGTIPVTAGSSTLDLAHPTQLRVGLGLGTVTVTVVHGGRDVYSGTIASGKTLDFTFAHPHVRGDLDLTANFETGEIAGSGSMEARIPFTGDWHDLLRIDPAHPKVLATFDPCSGVVGGQPKLQDAGKPNMDGNARFGPCALATPNILRIHVTDHGRVVNNIGQMVKRRLFKGTPEFVFNTVASVGGTDSPAYARHYTDPESPWFNLFLGYYQIDADESAGWTRPFGYRSDDAEASEPKFEELVQLGMADWNWFSNWNYGTPVEAIAAAEALDKSTPWKGERLPSTQIGKTWWHRVTIKGFIVASSYESDFPGSAQLRQNSVLSDVWRYFFGPPCPRPGHPQSFMPTTLDAELLMAYRKVDGTFHTYMFGGTVQQNESPGLLDDQVAATSQVFEKCYPALGFDKQPIDPQAAPPFDIQLPDMGRFVPGVNGGEWTQGAEKMSEQPV